MTEEQRLEEVAAEVVPLRGIAKWVRALAEAVLRRRRRAAVPTSDATTGLATIPHGYAGNATPETIAAAVTEAIQQGNVGAAVRKAARGRKEEMTMTKKTTTRPKSKRKTTLPVVLLLLLGAALGTTACGVRLPAVTFQPLDPKMAGGELPSVSRTVTTTDGVVLGGGSVYINPAAMLLELGKFTGALVGKLTGKPPVTVAPGPIAGAAGPRAGGV